MSQVLQMRSPINWAGAKSEIADVVWGYLGNPKTYIEPFAATAAVLLLRPHVGVNETLNDLDPFICNMHRALKYAPDDVAAYADDVVDEIDVRAKRAFLISRREVLAERLQRDIEHFDVRCAAHYVFLGGCTIGTQPPNGGNAKPKSQKNGIFSLGYRDEILTKFRLYQKRMERVRVLFGDWRRAVDSTSELDLGGATGILLDPPYEKTEYVYSEQSTGISAEVREWAVANGANPNLRIVLCGHKEHEGKLPADWRVHPWKRTGGYGNQADGEGRANAELETLYLSPHCEDPGKGQRSLFDLPEAA